MIQIGDRVRVARIILEEPDDYGMDTIEALMDFLGYEGQVTAFLCEGKWLRVAFRIGPGLHNETEDFKPGELDAL